MTRSRPARLLVLDSDPGAVRLIRHVLGREHRVAGASGETAALRLLDAGRFDLVLTDLSGQGIDVLHRLHGRPEPPPVLLVTGHPSGAQAARTLGAAGCVPKPFSLPELARAVRLALAAPRPRRSPHAVGFRPRGDAATREPARFLAEGLDRGDRILAITDGRTWAALARRLGEAGHDVDRLRGAGRIRHVESGEVLSRVMNQGSPDENAFRNLVDPLLAGEPRLRVYGDAVGLLVRRGRVRAALALEECWNRLRRERDFALT
jgi:CheY-like chemotaxis protein